MYRLNSKSHPFTQDYRLGKVLGKGSFSEVRECFCKTSNQKYAVKIFEKEANPDKKVIFNEANILSCIEHPNIVRMVDLYHNDSQVFLVMHLIEGVELFDSVVDAGGYSEEKALEIFRQIVDAVHYLHKLGIVHRDMKLENIILSGDIRPTLTDLGFAKQVSENDILKTRCGTPSYVAPEILLGEEYNHSVDVWSLGVILYVLLFCEYPFYGETLEELYSQILEARVTFPVEAHKVSEESKDLIKKMLHPEPKERLSLDCVKDHPWLKCISPSTVRNTQQVQD